MLMNKLSIVVSKSCRQSAGTPRSQQLEAGDVNNGTYWEPWLMVSIPRWLWMVYRYKCLKYVKSSLDENWGGVLLQVPNGPQ